MVSLLMGGSNQGVYVACKQVVCGAFKRNKSVLACFLVGGTWFYLNIFGPAVDHVGAFWQRLRRMGNNVEVKLVNLGCTAVERCYLGMAVNYGGAIVEYLGVGQCFDDDLEAYAVNIANTDTYFKFFHYYIYMITPVLG